MIIDMRFCNYGKDIALKVQDFIAVFVLMGLF